MNSAHLMVLGMGGTIAGLAHDPSKPMAYQAGALAITDLIREAASDFGELECIQVANIDSRHMHEALMIDLAHAVEAGLERDDISGIVITHGTDTLEETAIFLHATLGKLASHHKKAVVLTGAMLPANADHADGPANLRAALMLAKEAKQNQQFGVLAVMAGKPCLARELSKQHTHALDALVMSARELDGPIHKRQADVMLPTTIDWPWVEIVTSHAGASAKAVDLLVKEGVKGIVIAGTGQGSVHKEMSEALLMAAELGVAVVRSSRVGAGVVFSEIPEPDTQWNWVSARDLNPPKARIALQLALLEEKTTQNRDWRTIFATI
ncbi:asparaginase [Polynucleobacter sp. MWH-Loch1C5]|uniref:asparaginase n=1 Tax=Polynucleobacter sp. MWH-Loch1C5 TaxID=2689108 RepID=UPI001C0B665C|nr:asparaginase [Polynucleobacter sp. MWH-Loch1C5]MBU3541846.1 asparaginase [Polynucleobacter sp. MWH-Loch1C5]